MNFETVIGLEIHVQLKTKSKMFCGCDNNAENAEPNTLLCPVCMGMPGVLPAANSQAIEWTVKTGLALNCQVPEFSKFDRKHYFYPDLPKNYQISQFDLPFLIGGEVPIDIKGEKKTIRLRRIHLEEDAGKLIHAGDTSLVDLNRSGTPLMEIVTEPDIASPAEAKIFMQELRAILRYLDVSDADMEKGHLRCDANISIQLAADGTRQEGIPVEIKNINSFRMLERALIYEEQRQIGLLDRGEKITKETRGWNDAKGETYSQRSKERAQDYRYFPEPDLPPYQVKEIFNLDQLKREIPELPSQKRQRYVQEMGLALQDAEILALDKTFAEYFEQIAGQINPKLAANWVINELKFDGIMIISPQNLIGLLSAIEKQEISGKIAKEVLAEMIATGQKAGRIIENKGLKQVGDEAAIAKIIDAVLAENKNVVTDYQAGKTQALAFLVGQAMKKSAGRANPQIVNKILKERIQ